MGKRVYNNDQFIPNLTKFRIGDFLAIKVKVEAVMEESFPTLPENATVESVAALLKAYNAVLIKKGTKRVGIVTKADLIKAIND